MERVSEGSGVGVKGKIFIKVDKEQYAPGDLLTGSVFITIAEPIHCKELVVIVNGRESVSWDEGEPSTTIPFEKELLHHKIPLCSSSSSYEPGDYEYQFTYHLPSALPASFNVENMYHGPLERVRVDIRYTATAWLTAEGASVSYLAAAQPFVVYVPAAALAPERPIDGMVSENLRFLCCFNRGTCRVKAQVASNIHTAGEALQLHFQVDNSASQSSTSAINVELIEEITLMDVGNCTGMKIPTIISTQAFPGVPAGIRTESQVVMLALAQPSGPSGASRDVPLRATTTSQHFTSSHFVRITCKPFACQSITLE
uniref:Arrestin-like N-terminal domain-containing protein n=1 Tax=Globisporangium ultimum (strain ATCC 200006 / CBS 805.95 / DAOM BR144) TaxID=431595 RepID=K3WPC5_GLOUD